MTEYREQKLSVSMVCYLNPYAEILAAVRTVATAVASSSVDQAVINLVNNDDSRALDLASIERDCGELVEANCSLSLLQGHGNIGYGSAHNLVLDTCHTEYFMLMNVDVEIDIDAISNSLNYLESHSEVAVVSPHAVDEIGNKQYLCKREPSVFNFLIRGFAPAAIRELFSRRLSWYEMRDLSEEEPTHNIPIVSGCTMMCRTDALLKVGGFNEEYFLYFEDFDISMRLTEYYHLAYLPTMKIVHRGGKAAKKGLRHIRLFATSAFKYFNTYGWKWI